MVAVALLGLTACTLPGLGGGSATRTTAVPSQTPPPGMSGLEKFYGQTLLWKDCNSGDQCTRLQVPLDYTDPSGSVVELAVIKAPATGTSQGAILYNPGGPGGSAVDFVAGAPDRILNASVRRQFDLIGLDPRGVGHSDPIECLDDKELDAFLGQDPTPDTPDEEQAFADSSRGFADACKTNAGPLLPHVSTVDAAKDIDILRAAIGETKLNYLGASYGTFLGSTYAELFPQLVGRFVLDGVVPPDLTNEEMNLGQAKGFEQATRAWAADCVSTGDCALGTSVDQVMTSLRELFVQVDKSPPGNTGDSSVPRLTEGWASMGVAVAMYDQGMWSQLNDALAALVRRQDASGLMDLAGRYAERDPGGRYTSNITQVIYAVNCLDRPDNNSLADHERQAKEAEKVAPTWGTFLMWSSLPCGFWPAKGHSAPHKITAKGSGLIVLVGTTRDPATPYEWSVRLHDQLANSTLVTFDGDGHTAYGRSNSCVDSAIDSYFTKGTPPPPDLRC